MSDYRRWDAPVTKGGRGIDDVLAASIRAKYALPAMQSLLSIAGIENKRKGGKIMSEHPNAGPTWLGLLLKPA